MQRSVRQPNRLLIGCIVLFALVVVVAIAIVAVVAARFLDFGGASGQAESAARAYRASGMPWEAKDLRPELPLSSDKNAAPLLREAFRAFDDKTYRRDFPSNRNPLGTGSIAQVEAKLQPFERGLNMAVEASQRPDCDFGRDWDLGPALLFPELASLKNLAKGLTIRAEVEAAKDEPAKAEKDLRAAFQLGYFASRDPDLIGMLVECAVDAIGIVGVERCGYLLRDDPSGLAALGKTAAVIPIPSFGRALRGEAYLGLAVVRNLKAFGGVDALSKGASDGEDAPKVDPKTLVRTGLPKDAVSRAFATRHLQIWTQIQHLLDTYPNDPQQVSKEMDRISDDLEAHKTASNLLEMILLPVFGQAGQAVVKVEASQVALRALLVGMEQRLKTGRVPSKISDIPGRWIDPFTGKPMLVRKSGQWFRVYSVGPNLRDDGGVFQYELKGESKADFDVGVGYEPPPAK